MKSIILIISIFILISIQLNSFEIIEKKFKNSINLNFSQESGGSFFDVTGKNRTELVRYVDSIRYTNDLLSPVNYVFSKADQIYSMSVKYFPIENLAISGSVKSTYYSLGQREFFYFGFKEFQRNEKVSYSLNSKSEFLINNYSFGGEYYFTKNKFISNINANYAFSAVENNFAFKSNDSLSAEQIQGSISTLDSIYIREDGFRITEPNVASIGFLLGYQFDKSYFEFGNTTHIRSGEFKNINSSYLAVELTSNSLFKMRAKLIYNKVLGSEGETFDNQIPFRPFWSNTQEENLFINIGLAYVGEKYFAELTYGQTIFGYNTLNMGSINVGLSYFFDFSKKEVE